MRRSTTSALLISFAFLVGACTQGPEEATVIEVTDTNRTTTSTTEAARLQYDEFPELSVEEARLCNWINQTNRSLGDLDDQGAAADKGLTQTLTSRTLSDTQRVFAIRDNYIHINDLQSKGYAAIASGSSLAVSPEQAGFLSSAQKLVDRLASFNEDLAGLDRQDRVDAVVERQQQLFPPMVVGLEQDVASFNEWAWNHCETGGLQTIWDDFLPVDPADRQ